MNIAIIYDRLNKIGGAEDVLVALSELYPDAHWYTSVWNKNKASFSKDWRVTTSFIDKIPYIKNHHELVPFLMPFAFESFDLTAYDIVISVGSAESKGVLTRPETLHINYCLTPTRYLWSHKRDYLSSRQLGILKKIFSPIVPYIVRVMEMWDLVASTRPDVMISISEHVKSRVKKYYNRDTEVIYPPVDTKKFSDPNLIPNDYNLKPNYYLAVSRLVPYKKLDILVKAFKGTNKELLIVGTGSESKRLRRMASECDNIRFLGQVSDKELLRLYKGCRAFLHAGEEDFGIAMAQAASIGKPVIAYYKGGASEIIDDGVTGLLVKKATATAFRQAIEKSETITWSESQCSQKAQKFDKVIWLGQIEERINNLWETHKNKK